MILHELWRVLTRYFNEEELKTLCFELGIEYSDLEARGRANKARELVKRLERENRLHELVETGRKLRPQAAWPDVSALVEREEVLVVPDELRPYLELVARRSGRLPLGPLDPGGREGAHVSLGQLFVSLNAGLDYHQSLDTTQFYDAALAYIHHNRRLILLGDPGSGKSTLLRFLSYCLAHNALDPAAGRLTRLTWPAATKQHAPTAGRMELSQLARYRGSG